ncbi:MAG: GIY-YIG nuclease family protein [Cytophagales bacterium]|nr:GIY-YIG nuclease family protein [Cytophagales bacterium]
MYYVYVLESQKDEKYYIGYTSNVEKRVEYHNAGLQRSTRHRRPFKLIYKEAFEDKTKALKREKQIKSYKGEEAFRRLIIGT